MLNASKSRLSFDFDRAAGVMAALASTLGGVKVDPRSLNPYRQTKRPEYTVDDIERSYRIHKKAGRFTTQTITMDQVVSDA